MLEALVLRAVVVVRSTQQSRREGSKLFLDLMYLFVTIVDELVDCQCEYSFIPWQEFQLPVKFVVPQALYSANVWNNKAKPSSLVMHYTRTPSLSFHSILFMVFPWFAVARN